MIYQLHTISQTYFIYQCKSQFTKTSNEPKMLNEFCLNCGLLVSGKDSQDRILVADQIGTLFFLTFIRKNCECFIEAQRLNPNQR